MSIRDRLVTLFAEGGLTQTALSAASGVPQPTISAILSGDRGAEPRAEVVARLCRAMGLSPTAVGRMLYECYPEKTSGKLSGV